MIRTDEELDVLITQRIQEIHRHESKHRHTDWVQVSDDVDFSPKGKVYYHKGKMYDEASARHNGIIGKGHGLKAICTSLAKH